MKTVLYVDDNRDDLFLLQSACRIASVSFRLELAPGGVEAIDYLNGSGSFADRVGHPLPDFILLDLKMPLKDGFQVLQWIRRHAATRDIAVALYSSSVVSEDVLKGYLHGSTYFIPKFSELSRLIEFIQVLDKCLSSEPASCERLAELSVRA